MTIHEQDKHGYITLTTNTSICQGSRNDDKT